MLIKLTNRFQNYSSYFKLNWYHGYPINRCQHLSKVRGTIFYILLKMCKPETKTHILEVIKLYSVWKAFHQKSMRIYPKWARHLQLKVRLISHIHSIIELTICFHNYSSFSKRHIYRCQLLSQANGTIFNILLKICNPDPTAYIENWHRYLSID